MRSLVSLLVLLLVAVVHATSAGGDRLLVILEDVAEKATYSKFLGDLEGMYTNDNIVQHRFKEELQLIRP